jgi:hypothetical protein
VVGENQDLIAGGFNLPIFDLCKPSHANPVEHSTSMMDSQLLSIFRELAA